MLGLLLRELSLVVVRADYSLCAIPPQGFSLQWPLQLQSTGSRAFRLLWLLHMGFRALAQQLLWSTGSVVMGTGSVVTEHWLSSYGALAQQLRSTGSVVTEHRISSYGAQAQWLRSTGSVVMEHRLSSYGTLAQLLHGMWSFPDQGSNLYPALTERFFTNWARQTLQLGSQLSYFLRTY